MIVHATDGKIYNVPIAGDVAKQSLDISDNGYWEMQERILVTELNWVRRKLGKNPKACPNCGEELK